MNSIYVKRKVIKLDDIINFCTSVKNKSNPYSKKTVKKIIKRYLEIAIEQILKGYEWKFEGDFGTLVIRRHELNGKAPRTVITGSKGQPIPYKINLTRIGRYYEVEMISALLKQQGMYFRAANKVTKQLNKLLINTRIEYRAAE